MKNADVTWRFIDVMKEWQKLKKMTSMLPSHPGYIPPCRTNIRNFSIRFQGPKFFNSLSPEIENSESIRLFGKRLKKIPSFLVKYTLF